MTLLTLRLLLLFLLLLLPPLSLRLTTRLPSHPPRIPTLSSAHALITALSHPPPLPAPPPTPPARPRIALCIVGHLRTFSTRPVRTSIRRHLLRPLLTSGFALDIFFHVSRHDIPKPHTHPSTLPLARARALLRSFRPVHVSFFRNLPAPLRPPPSCTAPRKPPTHYPPALLRNYHCLRLVRRRERATAARYAWVYKTRPDVAFAADLSAPPALRPDTLYTNMHNPGTSAHAHPWLRAQFPHHPSVLAAPVADHVLVAARNVADVALTAVHAFRDCALYRLPNGTLNSEVALTYWVVRNRLRYTTLPWFWMLVREKDGPECFRVRWIRNASHQHDEALTRRCLEYKRTGRIPE